MNEYTYTIPPSIETIAGISSFDARELAEGFLERLGLLNVELDLLLHIHFIAVFRFSGINSVSGARGTGWVIGGRLPHLELNDLEIETPLEALAIYALYERSWLDAKGIPDSKGNVPVYRVPPDWNPLSYTPGFKDSRLGAITSYIAWNLIPKNRHALIHPDILAKCEERGWFN